MQTTDKYSQKVERAILADKEFSILQVQKLECIYSSLFDENQYPTLLSILREAKYDQLPQSQLSQTTQLREYLMAYKFVDQGDKEYLATVYDSDELWQDPQIVDIIPLKDGFS